eukprot:CAMPEP_0198268400 /NCGR_PEP_ID=MMETSP1447-20131203/37123_1 /TAXON_ID=420782 /ORGANISM="Chaetoceros dichaeta, Strain CCMP1751" /LENGTH=128 /DNA_ID=CAMNT_0043959431 /DNA_START=52 /DNA_END=438 /DNA_ORIENTATION=-
MAEAARANNSILINNGVRGSGITTKINPNQDEEEECFEACIFNCAYAEYQVDTEVKTYAQQPNSNKKLENPVDKRSMIEDVVISIDSSNSSSSDFNDDKSLLDLDSSSSLYSFEESRITGADVAVETR